tara:strand:+ start:413 stop:1033 length:621 start_codon:yes stop_codon:yes gene_type:complete
MTILSTAPQQRVSATQTADELSVLKANENEAIEMFHSDDPEERERGEAMLLSIVEHEQDLRKGCNRFIASAAKDDVFAAGLTGQIDALLVQVAQLEAQQRRFQKRAQRKRVYACSLLNTHFPEEKTHPTPWGNLGMLRAKPGLVNNDGKKLRPSDLPEDYEFLISTKEVTKTSTVKVIDEVQLLRRVVGGERFPFARLKENSTRFY